MDSDVATFSTGYVPTAPKCFATCEGWTVGRHTFLETSKGSIQGALQQTSGAPGPDAGVPEVALGDPEFAWSVHHPTA